jgi:hypothetical protein
MPVHFSRPYVGGVPSYVLTHRHEPCECRTAYAAWKGFDSPLRRRQTMASCRSGGHLMFWCVEARNEAAALAQLPAWLASRAEVVEVSEVAIP